MRVVRRQIIAILLGTLLLLPAAAQDGERERQELRGRLQDILGEVNLDAETAREVMRIMDREGWGELEAEDVGSILPALGYAQRTGQLPSDPQELARLAMRLGYNASELRRLGFTSREAARTLSLEVRRNGPPRAAGVGSDESGLPEGAAGAIRRAEQQRLRKELREKRQDRESERGSRPGFVPGTPKGEAPIGFDPGEPGVPDKLPDDDDDHDHDDDD